MSSNMHYSLIKHTPKRIKLLLKKRLQKSTNYASKIPQLIFPNSPVIYELETRTIQQKSVLNCSQNFSQNSLPNFSKSARSVQCNLSPICQTICVQKFQPFTALKRMFKTGEMQSRITQNSAGQGKTICMQNRPTDDYFQQKQGNFKN